MIVLYFDFTFCFCILILVTRISFEKALSEELSSHSYSTSGHLLGELWINSTYLAEDIGLNVTFLCQPFTKTDNFSFHNDTIKDLSISLSNDSVIVESESFQIRIDSNESQHILRIDDAQIASKFGLNVSLLDYYENLEINLGQICKFTPRVFWINDSSTALNLNLNTTVICIGYGSRSEETKINTTVLHELLNDAVSNTSAPENRTLTLKSK